MLNVRGYEYPVFEVINHSLKLANMFVHGREVSLCGLWLRNNAKHLEDLQFTSWVECVDFILCFMLPTETKPFDYFLQVPVATKLS